ncbi:twist-related protein 1-like [Hyalella azteca]|uniref:Twist-related protein 1-like n=1 Tax=Hyalella azteca TaxID=294128 RepID=A0A979FHA0_HYAAZ|nr:twist-related protein 1-like [Hyalella azteca]
MTVPERDSLSSPEGEVPPPSYDPPLDPPSGRQYSYWGERGGGTEPGGTQWGGTGGGTLEGAREGVREGVESQWEGTGGGRGEGSSRDVTDPKHCRMCWADCTVWSYVRHSSSSSSPFSSAPSLQSPTGIWRPNPA